MPGPRVDRPNILWFVSEDCSPWGPVYGDDFTATPTIERFAQRGVVFENAYCTVPVCAPSRFSILTGMYPTTCGPAHNMEAVAHLPDAVATYPDLARQRGYYCTNNFKTHYNCDVAPDRIWDESSPRAHWRNRPADTPFLAVFNCLDTHESAIFDDRDDGVDGGRLPAYLPDDPLIRRDRARLRRAVERMDGVFGELLAELAADGLEEDTIVLYSSDHGGSLPRSKRYCYDEGLRVPLVVRVPARWAHLSRWAPGSRVSDAVSLVDIAPTLTALTGGKPTSSMVGQALFGPAAPALRGYAFGSRDRMDERYDMVRTVRDARYRYIRNYRPDRVYGQHSAYAWTARSYQVWEHAHLAGALNPTQNAFWRSKPVEELYDTVADPDQVVDLAASSEHADTLRRLRSRLDAHLVATTDNGFLPEEHVLQGLTASGRPHDLPTTELLQLAGTAARRETRNVPLLVRRADDERDYVRYWVAVGLSMMSEQLGEDARRTLDRLMTDVSAPVRIEAAEGAARTRSAAVAIGVLGRELGRDRSDLSRLRALNALTLAGSGAAVHRDRIGELCEADHEYVRGAARYLRLVLDGTYTPDRSTFDWTRFSPY